MTRIIVNYINTLQGQNLMADHVIPQREKILEAEKKQRGLDMTKSEAIAITNLLPDAQKEVQEVHLRLKFHADGTMIMDDEHLKDSMSRLDKASNAIILVNKMAYSELG